MLKSTDFRNGAVAILFTLFTAVLFAGYQIQSAYAFSGDGAGTSGDPYRITDCEELQEMEDELDAHYVLMNNIDCSGTATWNANAGFDPVGTMGSLFTGSLNGGGYTVTGLTIDRPLEDHVGLFGYIGPAGSVSDLRLESVDIVANAIVGGLAGRNHGTVLRVHTSGSITAEAEEHATAGGLIGSNTQGGSITYSSSSASVSSELGATVGGLVGTYGWSASTLSHSYATGVVSGGENVGGLVGRSFSNGVISRSFALGDVSGANHVGGFIGIAQDSTIEDAYARGNVDGDEGVGGFIGRVQYATINKVYSTGSVTGDSHVGGLSGLRVSGNFTNSFWDTQASGTVTSNGGTGKITSFMKDVATYTDTATFGLSDSWDFTNTWFFLDGNDGYPQMAGIYFDGGHGSSLSPFQVATCAQLQNMQYALGSHFRLTGDIDCAATVTWNAGAGFAPIGDSTSAFTGRFDGKNKTISGLVIDRLADEDVGLFGGADGASISNVTITDADIVGSHSSAILAGELKGSTISGVAVEGTVEGGNAVGAIAGSASSSTISNTSADGLVRGGAHVGGLVGSLSESTVSYSNTDVGVIATGLNAGGLVGISQDSLVRNSYAVDDVEGDIFVGGLVGQNNGVIQNSYAHGSVTVITTVAGGLVGTLGGAESTLDILIENSYSTGTVMGPAGLGALVGTIANGGTVSASFWDADLSDAEDSAGGEGKSTEEMKVKSTFTNAGWNFSSVWNIDEEQGVVNDGYPFLRPAGQSSGGGGANTSPQNIDVQYIGAFCEAENTHRFAVVGDHLHSYIVSENENFIGADWQYFESDDITAKFSEGVSTVYLLFKSSNQSLSNVYTVNIGDWSVDCGDSEVEEPENPEPQPEPTVEVGDIIIGSTSTVYYITEGGKRRVFMNEASYYTWFSSFEGLKQVSAEILASFPLDGIMLPKAGTVLVKIQSSPKVYLLEATTDEFKPQLREIDSEATAIALYGADWADYVIDVEPTFFTKFALGAVVTGTTPVSIDLSKMMKRERLN